jgi:hypothetical protein
MYLGSQNTLKAYLDTFHDEIDFDAKNSTMQTLTHKIAMFYRCYESFDYGKYPRLVGALNDQIDAKDCYGKSPLIDFMNILGWCQRPFTSIINIMKFVTLEKYRKNFHIFANHVEGLKLIFHLYPDIFTHGGASNLLQSSIQFFKTSNSHPTDPVEAFKFLLTKIDNEEFTKVRHDDKNVLHLLCATKEPDIIEAAVKFMSNEELSFFAAEMDIRGQRPVDLLSDDCKCLLQELRNVTT